MPGNGFFCVFILPGTSIHAGGLDRKNALSKTETMICETWVSRMRQGVTSSRFCTAPIPGRDV
jgi:hypothetical protein